MKWMARIAACAAIMMALALLAAPLSHAGLTDKFKKKAEDKGNQEADKAIDGSDKKTDASKDGEQKSADSGEKTDAPKSSGDVGSVSTKFDFTPGDKLLFYDDFTQDELGEFPVHWKLKAGTLEVAEMKGQRWVRSTALDSHIAMKIPGTPSLPEFWTLEFDFFAENSGANVLTVTGMKGTQDVWQIIFPYSGHNMWFETGEVHADTPLETDDAFDHVHHVMFMARGTALKVYIDRQRLANVPEINAAPGAPDNIDIKLSSDKDALITNVRYAEGPKPMKDPFADGTLVTYGIYFDSGADVVKPESAPVLRQIAAYMSANPAVNVKIVGHTDNQGKADGNLDLSKRRSAAVAKVLADQFKLGANRFQTDGMGDTKPISKNDTSEGRAANRRVEFTKI
jgi:outer membrane protein OmpA-like peptidoglycan-associated protein